MNENDGFRMTMQKSWQRIQYNLFKEAEVKWDMRDDDERKVSKQQFMDLIRFNFLKVSGGRNQRFCMSLQDQVEDNYTYLL